MKLSEKKRKALKVLGCSAVLATGILIIGNPEVATAKSFVSSSEGKYKDRNCGYDNLGTSTLYSQYFFQRIASQNTGYVNGPIVNMNTEAYKLYENEAAWENDIAKHNGVTPIGDQRNIFVFAGHGLPYSFYYNNNNYLGSGLHYYTANAYVSTGVAKTHTTEYDDYANAQWDEIYLGEQSNRWSIFHTCRFLKDGGEVWLSNKIKSMFKGTHMIMGFGSRMVMTRDEGDMFGSLLRSGYSWRYSFFAAAREYQPLLNPIVNSDVAGNSNTQGNTVARLYAFSQYLNENAYASTEKAPVWTTANDSQMVKDEEWIKNTGTANY